MTIAPPSDRAWTHILSNIVAELGDIVLVPEHYAS